MIMDLSSPDGASVNDAIDPALCSLEYISVECVARKAWQLGPGALIAKTDTESVFRIIPVHLVDILLLGVLWQGNCYVDHMLPFGLRSAPKIFNAVADALEWVCQQAGIEHIFHYLDDFAIVGHPSANSTLPSSSGNARPWVFRWLRKKPRAQLPASGSRLIRWRGSCGCLPGSGHASKIRCGRCWAANLALLGFLQHATRVVKPGKSFTTTSGWV